MPQYAEALGAGWSPDTLRDVSAEQLAALKADPAAFLAELTRQDGTIVTASGAAVPRLPGRTYWMDDGAFCGAINLRFQPGCDDLPDYVPGHIGYAVVPWKRRRGYATAALALLLPIARELGLRRVEIVCDADNEASRRIVLRNGGFSAGLYRSAEGPAKELFRIVLGGS